MGSGVSSRLALAAALIAVLVLGACVSDERAFEASEPIPAGILQASYTSSIQVNVSDDVGRPVQGAVVRIAGNTSLWVTNLSGQVTILGLFADTDGTEYTLWAEKTGYDPSANRIIMTTPHNASYVDLDIQGGVILGWVYDQVGGIAGATVSISALGYSNKTDADGNYRLYGIPGGTHSVTASAPGYANQTRDVVLETGDFTTQHFSMVSLTGWISGLVLHASTLEPLEGANLSVRIDSVTVTVTSDANGTYLIPNLPSGTYSVSVVLEGFNSSTVSDVSVESGKGTEDIDILLQEKPTRLWGVVKAGTILLVGATVEVLGTSFIANSSIEGEYEIASIPAGTYTVQASLEGYETTVVTGVTISRGGELQLNINLVGKPGALFGVVMSSDTQEPLSGVVVTIVSVQRTTVTNINGEFTFTGLTSGNYSVLFVLDGFKPKEVGPVVITQESTARLEQVLLEPISEEFGGFIFGFDLAHSMMILALFLTIVILALAVVLRIRTFETPENAPAIFDDEEDEEEETGEEDEGRDSDEDEQRKNEIDGEDEQ
jgi:hypothetical protein